MARQLDGPRWSSMIWVDFRFERCGADKERFFGGRRFACETKFGGRTDDDLSGLALVRAPA